MPKVKGNSKYVKGYDEEVVQKALIEIQNGMPKKQAAVKYGIPRQTLQYRMSEKFKKIRHGPSSYLTEEEENTLEQWIVDSHRKGFPRRKNDVQASVKTFLDLNPRKTPFKDNIPGRHWYKSFLNRHPNLVNRTPEAVTKASSAISENDIRNWFVGIETYLKEKKYFDILEDPTRIYNGDETCFLLCPKEEKVIAPRGSKNVYQVDQGLAKANLTVMFTFAASGAVTPPMIIYPYKRLPTNIVNSVPGDWGLGISDNGWMKSELFFEYISNILYPHLLKENITFPIILFVDGHKTHMTYELSTLCSRLQIILIALYPNATRILQPADVSCFKPLKNAWKLAVLKWRRSNPFIQLNKVNFAPILQEALATLKSTSISNGFKACGLCPWNVNNINFSKCLGRSAKKPSVDQNTENYSSLTYGDFVEIIGVEKLEQIKTQSKSKNTDNVNDDFQLLGKIFQRLTNDGNDDNDDIDVSTIKIYDTDAAEPALLHEQFSFTEEQINEMPIINASISQASTSNSGVNKKIVILEDIRITRDDCVENDSLYYECDQEDIPSENTSIMELFPQSQNFSGGLTPVNYTKTSESTTDHINKTSQVELTSTPTKSIAQYLFWHHTPERKGKSQTERIPFVITSSGWKKIQEDKQKEKQIKEKKKEENKKKKELRTATKTSKEAAVKKKTHITNLTSSVQDTKYTTYTEEENSNIIEQTQIGRNTDGKKNISKDEENQQTSNNKDKEEHFPPKNNKIVNKGLCYLCTMNSTIANFSIKCENCIRTYHYRCLKKHNLYTEHFVCKSCQKSKNQ